MKTSSRKMYLVDVQLMWSCLIRFVYLEMIKLSEYFFKKWEICEFVQSTVHKSEIIKTEFKTKAKATNAYIFEDQPIMFLLKKIETVIKVVGN